MTLQVGMRVIDRATGRTGIVKANGGAFSGDMPFLIALDDGTFKHEIDYDGSCPVNKTVWEAL